MPWLVERNFHGKSHISIWFFNPLQKSEDGWLQGRVVEITDDEATLSIDKVIQAVANRKKFNSMEKKTNEFCERLEKIIKTSHHEGERASAKALYEKAMNRPYTGPEYRAPGS